MNNKERLTAICQAYKAMRNAQHVYFNTIKNNKTKGKVWVDPQPKLIEAKEAEKAADALVKETMAMLDAEAKAQNQPELFGRRKD
jgi:hypothetical protein